MKIVFLLVFSLLLSADILKENFLTFDINSSTPKLLVNFESDNLEKFIPLDKNQNGIISWSELKDKKEQIKKIILSHVKVSFDKKECDLEPLGFEVYRRVHQSYIKLPLKIKCNHPQKSVQVRYDLFFDVDKNQKAFVKLSKESQKPIIISPRVNETTFKVKEQKSTWQIFKEFWVDGVWHIWIGYDHILFLMMLLVPAVYTKTKQPIEKFSQVLKEILKIVTAFSIAHSFTLALSVTNTVQVNPNFIEVAIALSILFTALNNIFYFLKGEIWLVAFFFGLIHGFGFANVLNDMVDKKSSLATLLVGFNLGVESGQIVIVLAILPIFFFLRKTNFYKLFILKGFSLLTAIIATFWAIQRAFL